MQIWTKTITFIGETQENLGRINLVHKNPIVELADRFIFFAYFDNFEIIFPFFNA